MTGLFRKLMCRMLKIDEKRQTRQYRSLILEVKAKIDETMGYTSNVGLRTAAGYDAWRVSWMLDEKSKLHYPKLKQREFRPVRMYELHPDPQYKSPYFLYHQKGRFRTSFHFPFLKADNVIADFVVYTTEPLDRETAEEKLRRLCNTVTGYRKELSEIALGAYSLGDS